MGHVFDVATCAGGDARATDWADVVGLAVVVPRNDLYRVVSRENTIEQ